MAASFVESLNRTYEGLEPLRLQPEGKLSRDFCGFLFRTRERGHVHVTAEPVVFLGASTPKEPLPAPPP